MHDTGLTNAAFLLSEGSGSKTIYMKFKNATGADYEGTAAISFDLADDSTSTDRLPSMSIKYLPDNKIVGAPGGTNTTRVDIDVLAPNGVVRSFWEYDGFPKGDSSGEKKVDFLRTGAPDQDQWPGDGFHFAHYYAVDKAGIIFGCKYPFYKYYIEPDVNIPPTANVGPDVSVTVGIGNTEANVVVYGGHSTDPDGIIMLYEWVENGEVIAKGETFAARRLPGTYAITLRVTDNWGAQDSATVTITGLGTAPSTTPTQSPSAAPTSSPTNDGARQAEPLHLSQQSPSTSATR